MEVEIVLSGEEHVLTNVSFIVANVPGQPGMKVLKFITRNGNVYTIPLDQNAARTIGTQLTSGLIVAPGPLIDGKKVN